MDEHTRRLIICLVALVIILRIPAIRIQYVRRRPVKKVNNRKKQWPPIPNSLSHVTGQPKARIPVSNPSKPPVYCAICNAEYKYKAYLQQHLKTEINPLHCTKCDYKCIRKCMLKVHMKEHKRYGCSACDYKSDRLGYLRRHMRIHNPMYKCKVCHQTYKLKLELLLHMRIHTDKKTKEMGYWKCKLCDYRCIDRSVLQQHMKTHMVAKSFRCNKCNSMRTSLSRVCVGCWLQQSDM